MIPGPSIIRFAEYVADLRSGELWRQGHRLKLQDKPFQVLAALLLRPGELVSREELRQSLWAADTFVDFEHGLNTAVNKVREALRDSANNPRFIETLPRRGYRFIGAVSTGSQAHSEPIRSLAVLPLENLSGDPEQEYFRKNANCLTFRNNTECGLLTDRRKPRPRRNQRATFGAAACSSRTSFAHRRLVSGFLCC